MDKYEEALERGRKKIEEAAAIYGEGCAAVQLIRELLPELAESEDEKIRKELVNFILYKAGHLLDEDTEHRYITYLEKQKENHKSAISIPADCASNAKCPYRTNGDGDFVGDIKDTPAYWRGWDDAMKQKEQKPSTVTVLYIPKFREGDKVISTKNEHLTYDILGVGHINELGNPEYEVEIFVDGKRGANGMFPNESPDIKRIECQKMDEWGELVEQKPAEWNKEDEDKLYQIMETLLADKEVARRENPQLYDVLCIAYDELISWLKSLRPQPHWKPSEEQMEEVDLEKEINSYCGTRDIRPVPDFMDAVARHFYELGKNSK